MRRTIVAPSRQRMQTNIYRQVKQISSRKGPTTCVTAKLRYRKHTYRSVIDQIALKSITIPRPFDNEANAVHDLVHEPVHGDPRQSNDTTVSTAFVLDLACICPLGIHTARYTGPFHMTTIYTLPVVHTLRLHEAWRRPFPTEEIIHPYGDE